MPIYADRVGAAHKTPASAVPRLSASYSLLPIISNTNILRAIEQGRTQEAAPPVTQTRRFDQNSCGSDQPVFMNIPFRYDLHALPCSLPGYPNDASFHDASR